MKKITFTAAIIAAFLTAPVSASPLPPILDQVTDHCYIPRAEVFDKAGNLVGFETVSVASCGTITPRGDGTWFGYGVVVKPFSGSPGIGPRKVFKSDNYLGMPCFMRRPTGEMFVGDTWKTSDTNLPGKRRKYTFACDRALPLAPVDVKILKTLAPQFF